MGPPRAPTLARTVLIGKRPRRLSDVLAWSPMWQAGRSATASEWGAATRHKSIRAAWPCGSRGTGRGAEPWREQVRTIYRIGRVAGLTGGVVGRVPGRRSPTGGGRVRCVLAVVRARPVVGAEPLKLARHTSPDVDAIEKDDRRAADRCSVERPERPVSRPGRSTDATGWESHSPASPHRRTRDRSAVMPQPPFPGR